MWQKTTKTVYGRIVTGNGLPSRSGVMSGAKEKPLYLALGLAAVPAGLYSIARAVGLADLGRRVDLVERSIWRGEGDPYLVDALRKDTTDDWD